MIEFYYGPLADYFTQACLYVMVFLLVINLLGLLYQYSIGAKFTTDMFAKTDTLEEYLAFLRRAVNPHTNTEPMILLFIMMLGVSLPLLFGALPVLVIVAPIFYLAYRSRQKHLKINEAVEMLGGESV